MAHSSLMCHQPQARTEMDVKEEEMMSKILDRARVLISLWIKPEHANCKLQLLLTDGKKIDGRRTPRELLLRDGQTIYVGLEEQVSFNPLDDVFNSTDQTIPDLLEGAAFSDCDVNGMPSETDILNYEEAKQQAIQQAQQIERERGVKVSHRRILHDEAVDDYEDEDGYGDFQDHEGIGIEDSGSNYGYDEDAMLFMETQRLKKNEPDRDNILLAPWMQRLQSAITNTEGADLDLAVGPPSGERVDPGHRAGPSGMGRGFGGRPNPISPFDS